MKNHVIRYSIFSIIKFVLIIIITLFYLAVTNAQNESLKLIQVKPNYYSLDGNTYHYSSLLELLPQDVSIISAYDKSLKTLKASRHYGWISVGTFAVGIISPYILIDGTPDDCWIFCLTTGEQISLSNLLFFGPLLGTIGILKRVEYTTRKNKVIHHFNSNTLTYSTSQPSWNMNIGGQQHGIGIAINF